MTRFMLNVTEISLSMAAVIAVIMILAQFIGRKFTAKSRYIIWLIVLVRLAVPFDTGLIPSLFEFDIDDEPESVATSYETAVNIHGYETTMMVYAQANVTEYVSETTYTDGYSEYSDEISIIPDKAQVNVSSNFSYDTVLKVLTYVYICGVAIFFAWKIIAYLVYTEMITRSRFDVSDEVYDIYNRMCNDMNIRKKPEIYVSSYVKSPLLYGFFKPCVVLSDELTDTKSLSAVLSHELTHYIRRDLWLKLISLTAVSLHWFNPFVHIAAKKFEFEMELSCDEIVLNGFDDESRVAYGMVVLDIVKRCQKASGSLTTHFNTGSSVLKRRIVNIIDTTEKSKGRIFMISVLVICIFTGGIFAFTIGSGKPNGEKIELSNTEITSTDSEEISAVYLDTPLETIYAQMEQGLLTHEELLKYAEVQKDLVKDVNQLLDDYRAGIYPLKDLTGPRSVFREAPFPEECTIPSDIKWEDLQIALVDPEANQYGYAIVITLEDHYNMYIEAGYTGYTFDSGETVHKIWLWNVKFFYGDFGEYNNLALFSPYTAVCIHEKEFKEHLNNTIEEYRSGEAYEYGESLDITHTDSEISFPVKFSDGEQVVFTFSIIRENGKESYNQYGLVNPFGLEEQAVDSASTAPILEQMIENTVISIDSLDKWEDIAEYVDESYHVLLTALLESGEYAPYGAGDEYKYAFTETMKNVKFGEYTITPEDFYGDLTIVLDVEVLQSDIDLFPVGKKSYRISNAFPSMTIAPIDNAATGKYNFTDTPAQKALWLWFNTCRGYHLPKFGELPSGDMYKEYTEYRGTAEEFYMTDIGEYILFTYGGDEGLSAQEMQDYAKKCFGVDYSKHYDIIFEQDGLYYIGGHGGETWSLTVLDEVRKNDEITVTVQFYADFSKIVKSHLIEYHFKLLEDGTLVFNGSDIIEKASLNPTHMSV